MTNPISVGRPRGEPITAKSPSLSLRKPTVVGSFGTDRMPAQNEAWGRATWPESTITISSIPNALVMPRGLVLDAHGLAIPSTTPGLTADYVAQAERDFRRHRVAAPVLEHPHVLAMRPGLTCYGHVLGEILPNAWLIHDAGVNALIGSVTGPLDTVYQRVLSLLGYPQERVTKSNEPVRVRELIVIDGFATTGEYLSPRIREFAHDVKAASTPSDAHGSRLFLLRSIDHGRSLVNEEEVRTLLSRRGFVALRPELYDLDEQIAIFNDARVIVGALGSSLTNMMFGRPGIRILALAPIRMVDTFFWRLAGIFDHEYSELRCSTQMSRRSSATGRILDEDLIVDVEVLEAWLGSLPS